MNIRDDFDTVEFYMTGPAEWDVFVKPHRGEPIGVVRSYVGKAVFAAYDEFGNNDLSIKNLEDITAFMRQLEE